MGRSLNFIDPTRLTDREKQIYRLKLAGKTYQQISEEIGISKHTVASLLVSVRTKLAGGAVLEE